MFGPGKVAATFLRAMQETVLSAESFNTLLLLGHRLCSSGAAALCPPAFAQASFRPQLV